MPTFSDSLLGRAIILAVIVVASPFVIACLGVTTFGVAVATKGVADTAVSIFKPAK